MKFDQDTQTCARMGDALLTACERYAEGGIAPHLIVETAVAVAVGRAVTALDRYLFGRAFPALSQPVH